MEGDMYLIVIGVFRAHVGGPASSAVLAMYANVALGENKECMQGNVKGGGVRNSKGGMCMSSLDFHLPSPKC